MSTLPSVADIEVYRGDRYELFLLISNEVFNESTGQWEVSTYEDLTNWTITGQIRASKDSSTVAGEFAVTKSDQVTVRGGVLCVILPTVCATLVGDSYVFDIQGVLDADHVETFARGSITMTGDVTRGS